MKPRLLSKALASHHYHHHHHHHRHHHHHNHHHHHHYQHYHQHHHRHLRLVKGRRRWGWRGKGGWTQGWSSVRSWKYLICNIFLVWAMVLEHTTIIFNINIIVIVIEKNYGYRCLMGKETLLEGLSEWRCAIQERCIGIFERVSQLSIWSEDYCYDHHYDYYVEKFHFLRNKLPQKFPGQLDCLKLPKFVGFSNWSSLLDSEIGRERGGEIGDDDDIDIEYDHDDYM